MIWEEEFLWIDVSWKLGQYYAKSEREEWGFSFR
jgi:hypothetical protein